MRRSSLIAAVFLLFGCEDDPITMGRADTGIVQTDGGENGPLTLEPGMTFRYQGVLTARPNAAVGEHNSTWLMTITIDSVSDDGPGASSVTFSASSPTTMDDDWDATDEFDSWVGRLGPSLAEDIVDGAGVVRRLDSPPAIPAAPQGGNKVLPVAGTFFMDFRGVDQLRADFAQMNADLRPRVGDPSDNSGRWVFELSGQDQSVFYYTDKERSVRLEYDPRGFLMRIDESLGDPRRQTPPYATTRITLMSGP